MEEHRKAEDTYIGKSFTGLAMIKDKVIKPLLIATEKVVEYYFPEEKDQGKCF